VAEATHTVPIVFPVVADPVAAGFVNSLARPGSNATGFMTFEYGLGGKWLELLKQIAPRMTRVAVLRDPATPTGPAQFGVIQAVGPSVGIDVRAVDARDPDEIKQAVAALGANSDAGLIITPGATSQLYRDLIIMLAAQHKLPAVYYECLFASAGGLISYGPDFVEQFRRAAGYVDRILKGEKAADLPVQAPTKYDLVINLQQHGAVLAGRQVPSHEMEITSKLPILFRSAHHNRLPCSHCMRPSNTVVTQSFHSLDLYWQRFFAVQSRGPC
jgi:putative ABC transport system substrate-binding protein